MLLLFYTLGYLEYGILAPHPSQGLNQHPPHWKVKSCPLDYQEVPKQSNISQRIWNGKEEVRWLKRLLLKSQQWETIQSHRLNTAGEGIQALPSGLARRQMGVAPEQFSTSTGMLRHSSPLTWPLSSQNPCLAHDHKSTWTRKVVQNCQGNRRA